MLNLQALTPEMVNSLPHDEQIALLAKIKWRMTARPNQLPPEGDWTEWIFRVGRGGGKTHAGSNWLWEAAWDDPLRLPSAVIAPTQADVRYTCFEGVSGLLANIPPELVKEYNKSDLILTLKNDAIIRGFSSEKPERLRGPQFARAWCFPADTLVAMSDGSEKRIVDVLPGDTVLTRFGPRRVLASGLSGNDAPLYELDFGATKLTCTADHPILLNGAWVPAEQAEVGDQAWLLSGRMGVPGGNDPTGTTSARTSDTFTARFTSRKSDLFRRATSSIIAITALPTTIRAIWNFCAEANTHRTTAQASRYRPSTGKSSWLSAKPCETTLRRILSALTASGAGLSFLARPSEMPESFAAQAASNVTGRMPFGQNRVFALFVELATSLRKARNAFAARSAEHAMAKRDSAKASSKCATSPVSIAEQAFSRVESTRGFVGVPVPSISTVSIKSVSKLATREPVYDITVEGVHEFFANGIVVHNCDEVAAWSNAQDTWDMLQYCMRLGPNPQICYTSTPKPTEFVRNLMKPAKGRVIVTGSTFDNIANLSPEFIKKMKEGEGTQLYRQEVLGDVLDPEEAGIIKRSWFRLWPANAPLPRFDCILMSLDTAFTEATIDKKGNADYSACTVWGVFSHEKRTNVMLLDCWQEQLGLPDLIERVRKEMQIRYGDNEQDPVIKPMFGPSRPMNAGRKPDMLLIEDKGSGISLRQSLEREGIIAYAYNPGRADKLARLHQVSHVFARRLVWLPESQKREGVPRTWVEPLLSQLCAFTGSGSIKHDDLVDATTQAIRLLLDKSLLVMAEQERQRVGVGEEVERGPKKPVSNPYAT